MESCNTYDNADKCKVPFEVTEVKRCMPVPLCVPSNSVWDPTKKLLTIDETKKKGHVKICPSGKNLLRDIADEFVAVISATGPARSGKSFLLSQIQHGVSFRLGHSTEAATKGIWVAVCPQPIKVGETMVRLVLLDAEGLDSISDCNDEDNKWHNRILSLCALLSSTLIYNTMRVPTASDLDNLSFLAAFCNDVLNKAHGGNGEVTFCGTNAPDFVWLVRDFCLDPEVNGKLCDLQTFLLHKLSVLKGSTQIHPHIENTLVNAFQSFKAEAVPIPTVDKSAYRDLMANENKNIVSRDFVNTIKSIKSSLLSNVQIKQVNGCAISGKDMLTLLSTYVDAVNDECQSVPIESKWMSFVRMHLERSKDQSNKCYESIICSIQLPTLQQYLKDQHDQASRQANELFQTQTKQFHGNLKSKYEKLLSGMLEIELRKIEKRNESCSETFCNELYDTLMKKHFYEEKQNEADSSCKDIQIAKENLIREYNQEAKGPKAESVRKEKERALEETLREKRQVYRQMAFEKSVLMYEQKMQETIHDLLPCDNDKIEQSHNETSAFCFDIFYKVCDDCDGCKMWSIKMEHKLKELLQGLLDENMSLSLSNCQLLKEKLLCTFLDYSFKTKDSLQPQLFLLQKEQILQEYDQQAKGPSKSIIKTQLESKINERGSTYVNNAVIQADREYIARMKVFLQNGPYGSDELIKKHREVLDYVQQVVQDACNGIDYEHIKYGQKILQRSVDSAVTEYHEENEKKSRTLCQTLSLGVVEDLRQNCRRVLKSDTDSISSLESNFTKLQNFQRDAKKTYETNAKGVLKLFYEYDCAKKIDEEVSTTKLCLTERALAQARETFNTIITDFVQEGPWEEYELEKKYAETFNGIITSFQVKDLTVRDELLLRGYKESLQTELKADKLRYKAENEETSMQECIKLMDDVISTVKDSLDVLKIESSSETLEWSQLNNAGTKLREVKAKAVEHYGRNAKGPARKDVEKKLRLLINELLHCTQKDIADKALRKAKLESSSILSTYLSEETHDREELKKQLECISSGIVEIFDRECLGIAHEVVQENRQHLRNSIRDKINDVTKVIDSESWEQCSKIWKIVIGRHRQHLTDFRTGGSKGDLQRLLRSTETALRRFKKVPTSSAKIFFKGICEQFIADLNETAFEERLNEIVAILTKAFTKQITALIEEPCDEGKLREKQNQFERELMRDFEEKCQGIGDSLIETHKQKLQEHINQTKATLFEKNKRELDRECTIIKEKCLTGFHLSCKNFVQKVIGSLPDKSMNISMALDKLRRTFVDDFDREAKGHSKSKLREELINCMNETLDNTERLLIEDAIEKAKSTYNRLINNLIKELPCEECECEYKETPAALITVERIRELCAGLNKVETLANEDIMNMFQAFRDEKIVLLEKRNNQKSQNLCEGVMQQLLVRRKNFKNIQSVTEAYFKDAKGPIKYHVFNYYKSTWEQYFSRGFWKNLFR